MNAKVRDKFEAACSELAPGPGDVRISEMSARLVIAVATMMEGEKSKYRVSGKKKAANDLFVLAKLLDGLKQHIDQLSGDALEALTHVRVDHDESSREIAQSMGTLPLNERLKIEDDVLDVVLDAYIGARLGAVDSAIRDRDIVVFARRIPCPEELSHSALPRLSAAAKIAEHIVRSVPYPPDPPHEKKGLGSVTWAAGEIYEELTGLEVSRTNIDRPAHGRMVKSFRWFLKDVFDAIGIEKGVDYQVRNFIEERRKLFDDL